MKENEEKKVNQEEEKLLNLGSHKEEKQADEIKKVPSTIWKYIVSIFSFKQDTDVNIIEATGNIKKDIIFKGYNVWILMCSIVIASIGLNTNSVAIIIGAMLISPLMGPIKGIGLAVGTNNFKLLVFSLINFGIATGVSILVSFLYFKIMPFKDATPEILDRTEPLIIAVFVAFFGGLAGIIASAKNSNSTVVPGVAIATALMPPLCVTGYGLAIGNWTYFFGAFYLFFLNSLFIFIPTVMVVRYLKFPLETYINKRKERTIKIYFAVFLALIIIPSGMKFVEVYKKSVFKNTAELFIQDEIKQIKDVSVYGKEFDYENKKVTVFLIGNSYIQASRKEELQDKLQNEKYNLQGSELVIVQNDDLKEDSFTPDDYRMLAEDWKKKIVERDKHISFLEKENETKLELKYDLPKLKNKLNFEPEFSALNTFSASNSIKLNIEGEIDTILLIVTSWNDSLMRKDRTKRMNDWIKLNMETNDFELIEKLNN